MSNAIHDNSNNNSNTCLIIAFVSWENSTIFSQKKKERKKENEMIFYFSIFYFEALREKLYSNSPVFPLRFKFFLFLPGGGHPTARR